ncbi:winged helix-turn-helix domain-containing protein, partial [Klebsiella pneumoniae]|uniref:winged helix-turn-helix domain-containing protein n=1 Tax=Klebsiella pneumoniae TaxID=573 RepID=UPI0022455363
MKYIINFTITFDPDSRLLKLRNKDQLTIELSKPATRLLIELIKNNKNEMTRETLIKHVWEDYGFSPSSATLSNHISELRKAFEALGINKDILITVPRVGFKMEAEIHPETKNKELDTSTDGFGKNDITEDSAVQKKMIKKTVEAYGKKELHRVLKPILTLIFILLSIITIITILTRERNEEPKPLGTMNKCKIYALGDDFPDPELFSHARIMLSDIEIEALLNKS